MLAITDLCNPVLSVNKAFIYRYLQIIVTYGTALNTIILSGLIFVTQIKNGLISNIDEQMSFILYL